MTVPTTDFPASETITAPIRVHRRGALGPVGCALAVVALVGWSFIFLFLSVPFPRVAHTNMWTPPYLVAEAAICLLALAPIAALILGALALARNESGRGFAVAAIVLGGLVYTCGVSAVMIMGMNIAASWGLFA